MTSLLSRRRVLAGTGLAGLALVLTGTVGAADGTLPGGTSIGVSITSPSNGATLPAAPVSVTGTASVGEGVQQANTTLIYIVDLSGSTTAVTSTAAKCPVLSVYNQVAGSTLSCELDSVRKINQAAISAGTVGAIGLIGFGGSNTGGTPGSIHGSANDASAIDLAPATGTQNLVAPDAATFSP